MSYADDNPYRSMTYGTIAAHAEVNERADFIRKTYLHLAGAVFAFMGIEAVLLKTNYDRGWRASGATIRRDPIGFQLIRVPAGPRRVTLRFGASWDVWLGRAITLVTILLLLARVKPACIAAAALIPAVIAWGFLIRATPPTARIAEDAFVHIHPPLINSGGIVLDHGVAHIYGTDLAGRDVRVRIGDRVVRPEFASPGLINLRLPQDLPPSADVSVEVNGCAGNAFRLPTR